MRRYRLPIACLAAAMLVAGAAVVDHRIETSRGNHAQLLEWYCQHDGTHCGGPSSHRIEEHWELRERAYESAVSLLGVTGVALALWRCRRGYSRGRSAMEV